MHGLTPYGIECFVAGAAVAFIAFAIIGVCMMLHEAEQIHESRRRP